MLFRKSDETIHSTARLDFAPKYIRLHIARAKVGETKGGKYIFGKIFTNIRDGTYGGKLIFRLKKLYIVSAKLLVDTGEIIMLKRDAFIRDLSIAISAQFFINLHETVKMNRAVLMELRHEKPRRELHVAIHIFSYSLFASVEVGPIPVARGKGESAEGIKIFV